MKKSIPVSLIQQAAKKLGSAYLNVCLSKGKIVGSNLELSARDYDEIKKSFSANKPVEQSVKREVQSVKQEGQSVKQEVQSVKQEVRTVATSQNNRTEGDNSAVQS